MLRATYHMMGTKAIVTNHQSHGNLEVKRSPIKFNTSDTSTPKLPDAYVIYVNLTQNDVFAPRLGNREVRPLLEVRGVKVKDRLQRMTSSPGRYTTGY